MLFMPSSDIYIEALRRLVGRTFGGVQAVAMQAGLSAANLEQIINGVLNPSGRPRGVGPKVRDSLSTHFPNWLTPPGGVSADSGEAELLSIYRLIEPRDREMLLKMARLLIPSRDVENEHYGT